MLRSVKRKSPYQVDLSYFTITLPNGNLVSLLSKSKNFQSIEKASFDQIKKFVKSFDLFIKILSL